MKRITFISLFGKIPQIQEISQQLAPQSSDLISVVRTCLSRFHSLRHPPQTLSLRFVQADPCPCCRACPDTTYIHMDAQFSLERFKEAHARIRPHVRPSFIKRSKWLSDELEAEVFLKMECLHEGNSFKIRGATNALLTPTSTPLKVVTARWVACIFDY